MTGSGWGVDTDTAVSLATILRIKRWIDRERETQSDERAGGFFLYMPAPLSGEGWELPAGGVLLETETGRFSTINYWDKQADDYGAPATDVIDENGDPLTIERVLTELEIDDRTQLRGGRTAEIVRREGLCIPASKPFQVLGTPKVPIGTEVTLHTGRDGKGKYHTLMTVQPPKESGLPPVGEYEKCVLAAVSSIVEARGGYDEQGRLHGPMVIPITSIFRTMCGANKLNQTQRDQVMNALTILIYTPVVLDVSHERGEGWAGTRGLQTMIVGEITWDYTKNGAMAECLTIYRMPAFFMHAKRLGQIITVRPELLAGDGSSSNTRKNIILRRLLLERLDMFNRKRERSTIRITRSQNHPEDETVFERAGFDMGKAKQRAAAIKEAEKYLRFLCREGELGGFEILNERGKKPTARGSGAKRAYIKLHAARRLGSGNRTQ